MNSEQKCGEASEARRVRYPIGVQAFSQVRCDYGVYVGKTAFVYKLAHEDGKFFLSRPLWVGSRFSSRLFKNISRATRTCSKSLR